MNLIKILSGLFIIVTTLLSCSNNQISHPKNNNTHGKLSYSNVALYSIDTSIYKADDTITIFPDGSPAYRFFLGGASFIDSSGQPIHSRYTKIILTDSEKQTLNNSFLYKFCDNTRYACLTTYRDVLVFYDSLNRVIEQAQICFGCSDAEIYPYRDFLCQEEESDLDFKALDKFITSIKQRKIKNDNR